MPLKERFKILKVTMEVEYYVPMPDKDLVDDNGEEITSVNGWTMSKVKEEWFERYDINRYHATRNYSEISGSKKIIRIEEMKDDG